MTLVKIVVAVLALLISLSTHEYCHALVSYLLGDATARRLGRLSLNPLAHIDPIGTILVPLLGILSGLPVIGWAKPVPFNPYNLRYHKWGAVLVGFAGPVSNFLAAIVYILILKGVLAAGLSFSNLLVLFLVQLVLINVVLGLFNLLPVPPLDGSKLLETLLDAPKYRRFLYFLETRGPLILLLFIFLDSYSPVSIIGTVFTAAISAFFRLAGLGYLL